MYARAHTHIFTHGRMSWRVQENDVNVKEVCTVQHMCAEKKTEGKRGRIRHRKEAIESSRKAMLNVLLCCIYAFLVWVCVTELEISIIVMKTYYTHICTVCRCVCLLFVHNFIFLALKCIYRQSLHLCAAFPFIHYCCCL